MKRHLILRGVVCFFAIHLPLFSFIKASKISNNSRGDTTLLQGGRRHPRVLVAPPSHQNNDVERTQKIATTATASKHYSSSDTISDKEVYSIGKFEILLSPLSSLLSEMSIEVFLALLDKYLVRYISSFSLSSSSDGMHNYLSAEEKDVEMEIELISQKRKNERDTVVVILNVSAYSIILPRSSFDDDGPNNATTAAIARSNKEEHIKDDIVSFFRTSSLTLPLVHGLAISNIDSFRDMNRITFSRFFGKGDDANAIDIAASDVPFVFTSETQQYVEIADEVSNNMSQLSPQSSHSRIAFGLSLVLVTTIILMAGIMHMIGDLENLGQDDDLSSSKKILKMSQDVNKVNNIGGGCVSKNKQTNDSNEMYGNKNGKNSPGILDCNSNFHLGRDQQPTQRNFDERNITNDLYVNNLAKAENNYGRDITLDERSDNIDNANNIYKCNNSRTTSVTLENGIIISPVQKNNNTEKLSILSRSIGIFRNIGSSFIRSSGPEAKSSSSNVKKPPSSSSKSSDIISAGESNNVWSNMSKIVTRYSTANSLNTSPHEKIISDNDNLVISNNTNMGENENETADPFGTKESENDKDFITRRPNVYDVAESSAGEISAWSLLLSQASSSTDTNVGKVDDPSSLAASPKEQNLKNNNNEAVVGFRSFHPLSPAYETQSNLEEGRGGNNTEKQQQDNRKGNNQIYEQSEIVPCKKKEDSFASQNIFLNRFSKQQHNTNKGAFKTTLPPKNDSLTNNETSVSKHHDLYFGRIDDSSKFLASNNIQIMSSNRVGPHISEKSKNSKPDERSDLSWFHKIDMDRELPLLLDNEGFPATVGGAGRDESAPLSNECFAVKAASDLTIGRTAQQQQQAAVPTALKDEAFLSLNVNAHDNNDSRVHWANSFNEIAFDNYESGDFPDSPQHNIREGGEKTEMESSESSFCYTRRSFKSENSSSLNTIEYSESNSAENYTYDSSGCSTKYSSVQESWDTASRLTMDSALDTVHTASNKTIDSETVDSSYVSYRSRFGGSFDSDVSTVAHKSHDGCGYDYADFLKYIFFKESSNNRRA